MEVSTRAFERGALRPLSMRFSPKSRCIGKIFFWGSAPDPVMSDPTLDAPPRRSEGSCRPRDILPTHFFAPDFAFFGRFLTFLSGHVLIFVAAVMCRAGIDYWLHPLSQNTFSVVGSVQHQPPRSTSRRRILLSDACVAQRRILRWFPLPWPNRPPVAASSPCCRLKASSPGESKLPSQEGASVRGVR